MASVQSNAIQSLLDEISTIEITVNAVGNTGRAKLQDIKLGDIRNAVPMTATKVDSSQWSKLPENQQNELLDRLTAARDSLLHISRMDGPKDPDHLMYDEYASNKIIIGLSSLVLVVAGVLLTIIQSNWNKATATDYSLTLSEAVSAIQKVKEAQDNESKERLELSKISMDLEEARTKKDEITRKRHQESFEKRQAKVMSANEALKTAQTNANDAVLKLHEAVGTSADEGSVLGMVILLGALGGTLHLVGSLVKYVGNRQFKRSWVLYYVSTPVAGAVLAPIVYMLLRVGILSPTNGSSGASTIANLNLIAIYAFAALTGLFSKVASDKLAEVFQNLFRSGTATKDHFAATNPPRAG